MRDYVEKLQNLGQIEGSNQDIAKLGLRALDVTFQELVLSFSPHELGCFEGIPQFSKPQFHHL